MTTMISVYLSSDERAKRARAKLIAQLAPLPQLSGVGLRRRGDGWEIAVRIRGPIPAGAIPASVDGIPVVIKGR